MILKFQEYLPLIYAFLTAIFFGSCAPVTKYLITDTDPLILASLFYLGSGGGMVFLTSIRYIIKKTSSKDSKITVKDFPYLIGMSFFGGILAPVTLIYSMESTSAGTGALLLNFEPVATALIATFIFGESLGKRIWISMALITISCLLLSYKSSYLFGFSLGAIGVLMACIFWGIDNNISRVVSGRDPYTCIMVKGLLAGIITGIMAIFIGEKIPALFEIPLYLIIGFFSYGGLASVFFLMALRSLGTARTGLFLALSPFFGVFFSLILFKDSINYVFPIAFFIMLIGLYLLVTEKHTHIHTHPPTVHDHRHSHNDLHHDHLHSPNMPQLSKSGEHCHLHAHQFITHNHSHKPDLHHQHEHKKKR
jgi:drug/metabolite transporter (DMT)-like permease